MRKILFFFILFLNMMICVAQQTDRERDNTHPHYYTHITENIRANNPSQNLYLRYDDFIVTIENYDVLGEINLSNFYGEPFPIIDKGDNYYTHIVDSSHFYYVPTTDTLLLNEFIFTSSLFEKYIKIIPLTKDKNIHFKIAVATDESLTQLLPLEEFYDSDAEKKTQQLETWRNVGSYKSIPDSAKYNFKVPQEKDLSNIKELKSNLALRDTLVHYAGELSFDAEYVYKNKPSIYLMEGIVLKIEKYKQDQLIETKYIRTSIEYGC